MKAASCRDLKEHFFSVKIYQSALLIWASSMFITCLHCFWSNKILKNINHREQHPKAGRSFGLELPLEVDKYKSLKQKKRNGIQKRKLIQGVQRPPKPLKNVKNPEMIDTLEKVPEIPWKWGWSMKKYEKSLENWCLVWNDFSDDHIINFGS